MPAPPLLSEYFAARAQSLALISAARAEVETKAHAIAKWIEQRTQCTRERARARHRGQSYLAVARITRPFTDARLLRRESEAGASPGLLAGLSRFSGRSRSRPWQIAPAQLFHFRQFIDASQTEVIEENLCLFVKQRATRDVGAAGDFDHAAFDQLF